MSIIIVGSDGEKNDSEKNNCPKISPDYEIPDDVHPCLEIIKPDKQSEQPLLPPGIIPVVPRKQRIHEIIGDN
ncbi:hypothetical protein JW911_03175 [Candidatus Peregrinibacteria bacterium]|nr:hypothetical protein [Candidatus Peregrinibacteria bacterium]